MLDINIVPLSYDNTSWLILKKHYKKVLERESGRCPNPVGGKSSIIKSFRLEINEDKSETTASVM